MSNIERTIDHRDNNMTYDTKYLVLMPDGTLKKKCSNPDCGKVLPAEGGFHQTSRVKGTTKYLYRHCKCKECRNKEKRKYVKEKKNV